MDYKLFKLFLEICHFETWQKTKEVRKAYIHFKRTQAFKSEVDVLIESNPYQRRNTVNGEINLRLNLKLLDMLLKVSKKESLGESDLKDIEDLHSKMLSFSKARSFTNDADLDYLKKEIKKL